MSIFNIVDILLFQSVYILYIFNQVYFILYKINMYYFKFTFLVILVIYYNLLCFMYATSKFNYSLLYYKFIKITKNIP